MVIKFIYLAGVLGSSAIGLFVPPTWKRFLILGLILFLAFDLTGFVLFAIGSLISLVDDYYIRNPHPTIRPILYNKFSERLVQIIFLVEMVLAVISIAYKTIDILT